MTDSDSRYRAPALDKGLDILELLASEPQGLTRTEIVNASGRGPSEIYRMLERLVARNYVTRSQAGDRYALSLKLFALGNHHPPIERLVKRARPGMDAFAMAAEQSCHLGLYDHGNIMVIAQVNGPASWGLFIRVGVRVSLTATGSGLVMLAFQAPERRAEMLGEHVALDGEVAQGAAELARIVEGVRERGFWAGPSRQAQGVTDISMPILGPKETAHAVLTCPFIPRIDGHPGPDLETTCGLLKQTAQQLSFE